MKGFLRKKFFLDMIRWSEDNDNTIFKYQLLWYLATWNFHGKTLIIIWMPPKNSHRQLDIFFFSCSDIIDVYKERPFYCKTQHLESSTIIRKIILTYHHIFFKKSGGILSLMSKPIKGLWFMDDCCCCWSFV